MKVTIEVCIDNSESLTTAILAGANRIELCSALALGGLTPSPGFIQQAVALSPIPIYAMVRPRAGDFVFNQQEIDVMLADIAFMKQQGVAGVVVGILTAEGDINQPALKKLIQAADGIGVTFHRAFDLCRDPHSALEVLIELGCERVLTSGLQATAEQGSETIRQLVKQANQRISLMPGAGVNADNALNIVAITGASELHLSGKTRRPGAMLNRGDIKMGNNAEDDSSVEVTSYQRVKAVIDLFA